MELEEIERLKKKKKQSSPVSISQEDAGYNAIVAFDNLRKKKMQKSKLTDDQAYNLPETQKFIEYIHTFATKFPKSSSTPKVLYLAGNVHYSAKAYDAAIVEFKKIIANYGNTKHGKKAMRMLANTYAGAGEYNMALEKYRELLIREKPNTPGYKEVVDLAAGAMFKNANSIKKSGNLIGAADAYKSISADFPTSNIADRGWFEAGVSLEEANNLDLAAMTFKELGEKFPKSKLREKAYVRAAENYKKLGDFRKAGETFELAASKVAKADYAIPSLSSAADNYKKAKMFDKAGQMYEATMHRYPKDKRVPLAIYNGGLIFEKAKLYPKAIELYTVLANKYPESEYAAEGYYAIGYCYEKQKNYAAMAKAFNSYGNKFTGNRSKQVSAFVRAAEAYIKMDKLKDAQINAQSAVAIYEKFHKKAKIDPAAAAKAYYALGRVKQKQVDAIALKGKSSKVVQTKLKEKTKALEPALKAYAKSIEIGVGQWTIRSTYQIGKGFVDFANAFRNQTLFGTKDQKTASKIKIYQGLEKYYGKAMEKFEWNINKAYEQNIKNKWVDLSKTEFMRIAYKRGYLFEEIGLMFKNAPVPRGMDTEEKQIYKDVLEEKYLEALDFALPKYEEAINAAADLGIVGNAYTDSIKSRIEFINPSSSALEVQITEREDKPLAKKDDIGKTETVEEKREGPKAEEKKIETPTESVKQDEPEETSKKRRRKGRKKK
jgi:tetratricopeptide (TPR) repeat protein